MVDECLDLASELEMDGSKSDKNGSYLDFLQVSLIISFRFIHHLLWLLIPDMDDAFLPQLRRHAVQWLNNGFSLLQTIV